MADPPGIPPHTLPQSTDPGSTRDDMPAVRPLPTLPALDALAISKASSSPSPSYQALVPNAGTLSAPGMASGASDVAVLTTSPSPSPSHSAQALVPNAGTLSVPTSEPQKLPVSVGHFDGVHGKWKHKGDSTTSLREAYGILEWSDEPPETFEEQVIRTIDTSLHPIKMAEVALSMFDKKLSIFRLLKGHKFAEVGNDMLQYHILVRVAKHFLGGPLMKEKIPDFRNHEPEPLDGGINEEYAVFLAHNMAAPAQSAVTPSAEAQPAQSAQVAQPAPAPAPAAAAAASSALPPNKLSFPLQGYNSKVKKAPTPETPAPVSVESTASGFIGQEINKSLPLRQAAWKKNGDSGSPFAYELIIANAAAAQKYICKAERLGKASLLLSKGIELRFHYRGKDAYLVVVPPRSSRVDDIAPVLQRVWRVLVDWKNRGETHGYIALEKYFKDNRRPAPGQQPPRNRLASTQSSEMRRTGDDQSAKRPPLNQASSTESGKRKRTETPHGQSAQQTPRNQSASMQSSKRRRTEATPPIRSDDQPRGRRDESRGRPRDRHRREPRNKPQESGNRSSSRSGSFPPLRRRSAPMEQFSQEHGQSMPMAQQMWQSHGSQGPMTYVQGQLPYVQAPPAQGYPMGPPMLPPNERLMGQPYFQNLGAYPRAPMGPPNNGHDPPPQWRGQSDSGYPRAPYGRY